MADQRKPNQQVTRAGEHYVAVRYPGAAATGIDILACDSERTRVVSIRVKTK